jgi:hypothetical protein
MLKLESPALRIQIDESGTRTNPEYCLHSIEVRLGDHWQPVLAGSGFTFSTSRENVKGHDLLIRQSRGTLTFELRSTTPSWEASQILELHPELARIQRRQT